MALGHLAYPLGYGSCSLSTLVFTLQECTLTGESNWELKELSPFHLGSRPLQPGC
jgi:hypothetical protein